MKQLIPIFLIFTVIAVSGCVSEPQLNPEAECVKICQKFVSQGRDLSSGPCLSHNNLDWQVNDWVCDVAQDPRTAEDNLEENQCHAYIIEDAHHFVEVDSECNLIRSV
jgi:hypothetical protein